MLKQSEKAKPQSIREGGTENRRVSVKAPWFFPARRLRLPEESHYRLLSCEEDRMKYATPVIAALFLLTTFVGFAHAVQIGYTTQDLGSGQWEYTYTVQNSSPSVTTQEFTVFFDYGLYQNLDVSAYTSAKPNWSIITAEPVLILGSPQPGFYDALSLASGIPSDSNEGGFSVNFQWLGTGTPGSQGFDIVDTSTYATLYEGQTTPVPLPAALLLLGSGLTGIGVTRKMRKR
jgi:hypothetical protein